MERYSKTERARQFMPFAALKGYDALLREQERIETPKRLPFEEKAACLSRRLNQLRVGSDVEVVHYGTNAYLRTRGMIKSIDFVFRKLAVGKETIRFEDIFDLRIV